MQGLKHLSANLLNIEDSFELYQQYTTHMSSRRMGLEALFFKDPLGGSGAQVPITGMKIDLLYRALPYTMILPT